MRLRHIIIFSIIAFLIGGAIWVYDNAGNGLATGAGGLPLIKASTDPVKLPPEDPGGEVMPHADSTVFAAISHSDDQDPSMEGLKLPPSEDEAPETNSDFAGLKTGFALPSEPESKTESLFTGQTVTTSSGRSYVTGIEPTEEPVITHEEARVQAVEPEPVVAELKVEQAPEPKAEPTSVVKKETPAPAPVAEVEHIEEPVVEAPVVLNTETPGEAAQALEEQEKQLIRPSSKPSAPAKPVSATPEPTVEKVVEEIVAAPINGAVQTVPMKPQDEPIARIERLQTTTPAVASGGTGGGYVIQLSSTPSQADAQNSWSRMQSLYPDALRGLQPSYKSAEVPGKGTFIRLRAGTLSREEANSRCDAIRREDPRGGGCLVIRE